MAHLRSNKDGARGQGVAEFAIVLPVLALILLSIFILTPSISTSPDIGSVSNFS